MSSIDDSDLTALVGEVGLLRGLGHAAVERLVAGAEQRTIHAGAHLYRSGEPADSLAIVMIGRLSALRDGAVVAEVTRGGVTGELGVLTGEVRAADIVAARDTEVLVVPRRAVIDELEADAGAAVVAAAAVADLVRRPPRLDRSATVVALVRASPAGDPVGIARRLADVLGAELIEGPIESDDVIRRVARAESDGRVLLAVSNDEPSGHSSDAVDGGRAWRDVCMRQADVILHVAASTDAVAVGIPEGARHELVLCHPGGAIRPGAASWLAAETQRRHHVRAGVTDDVERLARRIAGRSVGLVLSGGGARGLAHLGVYRALHEAGVPIDYVAGSSIGAITGAQIASLGDPQALIDANVEAFASADFGRRFTVPLLSVLSLRTALPLFERLFADLDLADTPAMPIVTVVDFTTCDVAHRRVGRAATWTRASASPPGLWPPVSVDGHLFVDGAVLDNLPVAAVREAGAARVMAIDVSRAERFDAPDGSQDVTSWGRLLDPRPSRRVVGYPTLPKMVMRLSLLSSLPKKAAAQADADLLVEPDTAGLSLGDYRRSAEAVRIGYDAMRAALETNAALVDGWR